MNVNWKKANLFALSFLFWQLGLFAQGPPIFTDTPIMLGLEGGGIRTFGKYIKKEELQVYTQPIAIPFNLRAHWQIGSIVSWVGLWPQGEKGHFGLGDVKVFSKYQLFARNGKGKTFRTLIKLVQSFPSGAKPLGSGHWTTSFHIVSGWITLDYGLYANLAYQLATGPQAGKATYNLALAYPLLPQQYPPKQLNLYLEFSGSYVPQTQKKAHFIAPGIQWINGRKFLVETGWQIPLYEDAEEGSRTRFAYLLGIRILLF